jgi:PAS domain S-box-containing protein
MAQRKEQDSPIGPAGARAREADDITVMRRILDIAVQAAAADGAYLERIVDDHWVEVVAASDRGAPHVGLRVPFPGSLTREVMDDQKPEVVENVAWAGRPIGEMLEGACGACSGLVIPLVEGGAPLGALVLLRRPGRPAFLAEETERVRLFGSMAALAMQRNLLLREAEHAHEELRVSRREYRALYEANPTIYITTDERGVMVSVNAFGAEAMGYRREELVGRSVREIVRADCRAAFDEHFRWCLAHPEEVHRIEVLKVRGDGTSMHVREAARSVRDHDEKLTVLHVCDDISREVAVREALRRSSEQHAYLAEAGQLLASSLDYHRTLETIAWLAVPRIADWCAVYVVEEDGRTERVAVSHADPSRRGLVEEYLRLYPIDPQGEAGVAKVIRTGSAELLPHISDDVLRALSVDERQYSMLREMGLSSGVIVPMQADDQVLGAITLISAESGRIFGEEDLEFARNLANRAALSVVKARLFREAKEASRIRDDVLAVVSHDLRNPLGTILMSAGFLLEEDPAPEQWRKQLEIVRRSAERMNRLIGDLLDVSKLESGTLAVDAHPAEARELLAEAVTSHRIAAESAGLTLECSIAERLPAVCVDRERIQQVLGNLLGNAIKFTPAGGRVAVRAEADDGGVTVTVSDTGPGIPAEEQPHLFERFWQSARTRRGGAGLGLAISKGIVEAHGGRISVESAVEDGTCFRFTLPTAPVG